MADDTYVDFVLLTLSTSRLAFPPLASTLVAEHFSSFLRGLPIARLAWFFNTYTLCGVLPSHYARAHGFGSWPLSHLVPSFLGRADAGLSLNMSSMSTYL